MIDFLLSLLVAPFAFACLYLGFLAVVALTARRNQECPAQNALPSTPTSRFLVLIPAHNEEHSLLDTLRSVHKLSYPAERYDVCVIADNCTDNTGLLATQAGALVLTRDSDIRGKGAALSFAFDCLPLEKYDGIVIIDADTVVNHDLLQAFHSSLAAGEVAMQGTYRVRNPIDNWRTELMNLAFALVHEVRGTARHKLGLSCGLKGNGMCFHPKVLRKVPHCGNSITEDLEYTACLTLAGARIAFVAQAIVYATMPTGEYASTTQRERWESGRWALLRRFASPLLRSVLFRRNGLAMDVFLELCVPPLAHLAFAMGAFGCGALVGILVGTPLWLTFGEVLGGLAALLFYLAVGHRWTNGGPPLPRLVFHALRYAAWKMTRTSFWRQQERWIRTDRVTAP